MIHLHINGIKRQADIRRIILVYKLPLQLLTLDLGLGLGLKAKIFGLEVQVLGLAA